MLKIELFLINVLYKIKESRKSEQENKIEESMFECRFVNT